MPNEAGSKCGSTFFGLWVDWMGHTAPCVHWARSAFGTTFFAVWLDWMCYTAACPSCQCLLSGPHFLQSGWNGWSAPTYPPGLGPLLRPHFLQAGWTGWAKHPHVHLVNVHFQGCIFCSLGGLGGPSTHMSICSMSAFRATFFAFWVDWMGHTDISTWARFAFSTAFFAVWLDWMGHIAACPSCQCPLSGLHFLQSGWNGWATPTYPPCQCPLLGLHFLQSGWTGWA